MPAAEAAGKGYGRPHHTWDQRNRTDDLNRTSLAVAATAAAAVPRWPSAAPVAAPGDGTVERRQCKRRASAETHGEITPRGRRGAGGTRCAG